MSLSEHYFTTSLFQRDIIYFLETKLEQEWINQLMKKGQGLMQFDYLVLNMYNTYFITYVYLSNYTGLAYLVFPETGKFD